MGDPVIHVGDACQDTESILRKKGLIKCCVLPPQKMYHPVIPFRCNDRLFLCPCNSSGTEHNEDRDCANEKVSDRILIGTWVIDEVRLAVQKSYVVIEIFGVY